MDCPQDNPWTFRRLSHGLSVDIPWDKALCIRFSLVDDGLIYDGMTIQSLQITPAGGLLHAVEDDGQG